MKNDLDTSLFDYLTNASKKVHDQVFEDIKPYGLTYENLRVLECLYDHGPHYIQTLSDKLYIPSGSITYIINKLEKKELVHREIQSTNKRFCKVFLTNEGERLFAEVNSIYNNNIKEVFSKIDLKPKEKILDALKQLCNSEELESKP